MAGHTEQYFLRLLKLPIYVCLCVFFKFKSAIRMTFKHQKSSKAQFRCKAPDQFIIPDQSTTAPLPHILPHQ